MKFIINIVVTASFDFLLRFREASFRPSKWMMHTASAVNNRVVEISPFGIRRSCPEFLQ
jgi:hypothetical protein